MIIIGTWSDGATIDLRGLAAREGLTKFLAAWRFGSDVGYLTSHGTSVLTYRPCRPLPRPPLDPASPSQPSPLDWNKEGRGSTRAEIYDELLSIIGDHAALQAVDADAVAALLKQPEGGGSIRGNGGNGMTQEIKWACKFHRTRGVHVTPTVHVNGLEAGIVSSGWTEEQWCAFLEPMGDDKFTGSKLP